MGILTYLKRMMFEPELALGIANTPIEVINNKFTITNNRVTKEYNFTDLKRFTVENNEELLLDNTVNSVDGLLVKDNDDVSYEFKFYLCDEIFTLKLNGSNCINETIEIANNILVKGA